MVAENEKRKEVLRFDIEDGPPELDFLFALARGARLMFTLETKGVRNEMWVHIDGITMSENDLKERGKWRIRGRFGGDGMRSWSSFLYEIDNARKLEGRYVVWGEFKGTYDKRTRKGLLVTENFKVEHIPIMI